MLENNLWLSRRDWLRLAAAGVAAYSSSGWLESLAQASARDPRRRRSCILLWMNGGPSQADTFDLKPGHPNGGPFKETQTSVPGIRISEHLPSLAKQMENMSLVRSMKTKEGDHGRATFLLRTGYLPQGPIEYPALGSLVAKELSDDALELPSYVSIGSRRFVNPAAFRAGFLGPQYAPLVVGETGFGPENMDEGLKVPDLQRPPGIASGRADARIGLLQGLEEKFAEGRVGVAARSHRTAYERAARLMRSAASNAFNLNEEPASVRDAYGRSLFGQGCLLARRLVERGVPFVEVTLDNWDTHVKNFDAVKRLSGVLDPAWATLMKDLKTRGLLDTTLIVWMGEFGRTPKINGQSGRDHFPNAWSTVLAGGGIRGGQVVGKTSADATTIEDRPVSVPDLLATVCLALGIDPLKHNDSNIRRPIRIVDKSNQPIQEVLAT
jgi:hypothetical protein